MGQLIAEGAVETTVSMLQPAGPLACDQIQMALGHWLSQTNSGLALGQELARDRHGADAFMRSWQLGFGSEKPSRTSDGRNYRREVGFLGVVKRRRPRP